MSPRGGQLVTEALDYDDGRPVTVYVPNLPPTAVVYAADGGWHLDALSEALEDAAGEPTMIVGVHGLPSG